MCPEACHMLAVPTCNPSVGSAQEAHASTEQRAAAAEKSVRAIQRELSDLEAAVRAQAGQDAARAQASAEQQLTVMRAELKVGLMISLPPSRRRVCSVLHFSLHSWLLRRYCCRHR